MIKANNISFSYGDRSLFTGATFSVGKGMKVAIVGPNGAGKSTLFKLIMKEEVSDTGVISVEGSVSMVPQEVRHDSILDMSASVWGYLDPTQTVPEFELKRMLAGIGLGDVQLYTQPIVLSGGQKTRLAILRALIEQPDLLLLDEPTNFLDTEGKRWVMDFLSTYPKTLLLISHDLDLIDGSIDKVIAINPITQKLDEFKGTYSSYLRYKKQQDELLKRHIIQEKKHIERMKKGLTKMDRYTSEKGVRQRTQLKKRIRKLEEALPDLPRDAKRIKFSFKTPTHVGEVPIMVNDLSKFYDGCTVLSQLSFIIKRSEKVALIGPNGAGKSTLIKILMKLELPDSGRIDNDEKLDIGYYSQELESLPQEKTILEAVRLQTDAGDNIIRPLLAGFLFPGNKVHQQIHKLSGGEKTRLSIALLLAKNHNMLILDEPTTYLDLMSQRVILEALKQYPGTLLIVSHEHAFMRELAPDKALVLPEGEMVRWDNSLLDKVAEM